MKCDKHCFTPFFPYNVRHQEKIIILGGQRYVHKRVFEALGQCQRLYDGGSHQEEGSCRRGARCGDSHQQVEPRQNRTRPQPQEWLHGYHQHEGVNTRKKEISFSLARGSFHLDKIRKNRQMERQPFVCCWIKKHELWRKIGRKSYEQENIKK